ncbi:MAG: hypothetical protein WBL21_00660 [Salinimicrobium sp.]
MKNLLIYYMLLFIPGILLALSWDRFSGHTNLVLLGIYIFVYRTLLDGLRLRAMGVLETKEIWKMAIPGVRGKYFKQLYFTK